MSKIEELLTLWEQEKRTLIQLPQTPQFWEIRKRTVAYIKLLEQEMAELKKKGDSKDGNSR